MNWNKRIEEFSEREYIRTHDVEQDNGSIETINIKFIWEYLDEGYSGYYDSNDKEDVPLLRFCLYKSNSQEDYEQVEDGTYCTLMPIDAGETMLDAAAWRVLNDVAWNIAVNSSYRKDLELWSWMEPDWFYEAQE